MSAIIEEMEYGRLVFEIGVAIVIVSAILSLVAVLLASLVLSVISGVLFILGWIIVLWGIHRFMTSSLILAYSKE